MFSRELEVTLRRAFAFANDWHHEFVTLEHLVQALALDEDATAFFTEAGIDVGELGNNVRQHIADNYDSLVKDGADEPRPTAGLQRALNRAMLWVDSHGQREVTGAHVVAGILEEQDSPAVFLLGQAGLTHEIALRILEHGRYIQTASEVVGRVFRRLQQSPTGVSVLVGDDHFYLSFVGGNSDIAAAMDPLTRQLHEALKAKARVFANVAHKLDNQLGWTGIGRTAQRFSALIACDTSEIPNKLGLVWNELVALGSFLDLDNTLRATPDSFASPLEPEALRPLQDLIRSGAPWVRQFPTARQLDDSSGAFLARGDLLEPGYRVFSIAGEGALLGKEDLEALKELVAAARRGAFQGDKARTRTIFSAKNLITAVCAFYIGAMNNNFASNSLLAQRGAAFMVEAESSILALFEDAPPDVRNALRLLLQNLPQTPTLPPNPTDSLPTRVRRNDEE